MTIDELIKLIPAGKRDAAIAYLEGLVHGLKIVEQEARKTKESDRGK